jgi:hypothetical protein
MARRCHALDTTSVALTGESVPDGDEPAMRLTHGDSHDHRPDLQPAGWELWVAQDGGVPCVSTRWDGNTADTQGVQERAEAVMSVVTDPPSPRDLVAEAPLDCADKAAPLAPLGLLTRMPAAPQGGGAGHEPSAPAGHLGAG